jgi:hypothetical protein
MYTYVCMYIYILLGSPSTHLSPTSQRLHMAAQVFAPWAW